jgi:hypothetical protein
MRRSGTLTAEVVTRKNDVELTVAKVTSAGRAATDDAIIPNPAKAGSKLAASLAVSGFDGTSARISSS